MLMKAAFVLFLLYMIVVQPYWFAVGIFAVTGYLTIVEVDKRKRSGRW